MVTRGELNATLTKRDVTLPLTLSLARRVQIVHHRIRGSTREGREQVYAMEEKLRRREGRLWKVDWLNSRLSFKPLEFWIQVSNLCLTILI